jgi:hypothetical protein
MDIIGTALSTMLGGEGFSLPGQVDDEVIVGYAIQGSHFIVTNTFYGTIGADNVVILDDGTEIEVDADGKRRLPQVFGSETLGFTVYADDNAIIELDNLNIVSAVVADGVKEVRCTNCEAFSFKGVQSVYDYPDSMYYLPHNSNMITITATEQGLVYHTVRVLIGDDDITQIIDTTTLRTGAVIAYSFYKSRLIDVLIDTSGDEESDDYTASITIPNNPIAVDCDAMTNGSRRIEDEWGSGLRITSVSFPNTIKYMNSKFFSKPSVFPANVKAVTQKAFSGNEIHFDSASAPYIWDADEKIVSSIAVVPVGARANYERYFEYVYEDGETLPQYVSSPVTQYSRGTFDVTTGEFIQSASGTVSSSVLFSTFVSSWLWFTPAVYSRFMIVCYDKSTGEYVGIYNGNTVEKTEHWFPSSGNNPTVYSKKIDECDVRIIAESTRMYVTDRVYGFPIS